MDAPDTSIALELPPGVELVAGETQWQTDLVAGVPFEQPLTINFTEVGEYAIRAVATKVVNEDMIWGDDAYIYLTVREDGGSFGYESGGNTELQGSVTPYP
jgi:hypothetical protein